MADPAIDAPVDVLSYDEALAWFQGRLPLTRDQWDALDAEAKRHAFVVSNVAEADIVADVWASLDRALTGGETLEEWKASAGPVLEAAWGGAVENPAWRLETIFRTNGLGAYNAGRLQQMQDPDVLADRPYWMFDAIEDQRTTDVCTACDGVVLAADHPWWNTHYPTLHFNCRSQIINLSHAEAAGLGIRVSPPAATPMRGFGHKPALAGGGGFSHAGAWRPDPADYPTPIGDVLKTRLPGT